MQDISTTDAVHYGCSISALPMQCTTDAGYQHYLCSALQMQDISTTYAVHYRCRISALPMQCTIDALYQHYLCSALPMQDISTTYAVHYQCRISALPMQCTTDAVYQHYLSSALPMQETSTTYAVYWHYLCSVLALPVYCISTMECDGSYSFRPLGQPVCPTQSLYRYKIGALDRGSPMSPVDFKKWQCPLLLFLKFPCRF